MTYAFNLTFTRPDENDANVYTCGMNVEAVTLAQAEDKLRHRNSHLTVSKVELFGVNNDGELILTSAMQRSQLNSLLDTIAKLAEGAAAGLGVARGIELQYYVDQARFVNNATIVEVVR